MKLKVRTKEKT